MQHYIVCVYIYINIYCQWLLSVHRSPADGKQCRNCTVLLSCSHYSLGIVCVCVCLCVWYLDQSNLRRIVCATGHWQFEFKFTTTTTNNNNTRIKQTKEVNTIIILENKRFYVFTLCFFLFILFLLFFHCNMTY